MRLTINVREEGIALEVFNNFPEEVIKHIHAIPSKNQGHELMVLI